MSRRETLLNLEIGSVGRAISILVLCILSGFVTWVVDGHNIWIQWVWLLHIFAGICFTFLWIPYLWIHIRRTFGFRRWSVFLSGVLASIVVLIVILSGWIILVSGISEQTRWLSSYHVLFAAILLILSGIHILLHLVTLSDRRKKEYAFDKFPSLRKLSIARVFSLSIGSSMAVLCATVLYIGLKPSYSDSPIVKDYEYPYGSHPFRPSQTETWHDGFVDLRQIANSKNCISCHDDIATEWSSSIHKQAASDATYVRNVSLLADKKGIAATRYCEGCHAPIALLTGELSEGGKHGGIQDTPANVEGIGCMGCHGIHKAVHLKGVASYEFKAADDYLFAFADFPVLNLLRNTLIKVHPEQHRHDVAPSIINSPTQCATCHVQFMDRDMNNWGWVKMQDEFNAWLDSPYSRQHDVTFASAKAVRCQDCHMPLVEGDDPSSDVDGRHRSHRFIAANTVVPLLNGDKEQLRLTKQFLQQNKMRLAIDEPRRTDAKQTLMALDETLRPRDETPFYVYIGEKVELTVIVTNTGVGHNFPGGTIDINEAWLEFNVVDGAGTTVYESGFIDRDSNMVDDNAVFYRSLPTDPEGNLVWKHDLFNRVGQAYKRIVPSGKSDLVPFKFEVPSWVKSPLSVSARLRFRKLNTRYAKWALQEKYQKIPIIDVARTSLLVPVQIKPPIE